MRPRRYPAYSTRSGRRRPPARRSGRRRAYWDTPEVADARPAEAEPAEAAALREGRHRHQRQSRNDRDSERARAVARRRFISKVSYRGGSTKPYMPSPPGGSLHALCPSDDDHVLAGGADLASAQDAGQPTNDAPNPTPRQDYSLPEGRTWGSTSASTSTRTASRSGGRALRREQLPDRATGKMSDLPTVLRSTPRASS